MKKYNIFLVLIWLVIVCFTAFNHEIWRDEAQVWCIIRDLNIFDAFSAARIEGHPFLWYLLIMPFAKLGLPVETMQFVCIFIVFVSVVFFVFKSPFTAFQKMIVILSAGMLYYLPVVVRNYALIPLLIFLLAYLYEKREEKPYLYSILIILLSHTHLYMLGFCGALFLLFAYEQIKKKNWNDLKPIFLLVLNFVFIFLFFYNTQNENYALDSTVKTTLSFVGVLSLIAKVLFYNLAKISTLTIKYFDYISIFLFYPFVVAILSSLVKNDKKCAFIAFCGIGFILFVFTQIYFNGILYQKIFLIFLMLIFCVWIAKVKTKVLMFSFNVLFIVGMLVSPFVITEEIKYNFSGGKQIASYIKENYKEEKTFVTVGNPFLFSTISAYLPDKKFYNVIVEDYTSFYTYASRKNEDKKHFPNDAEINIVTEKADLQDNPYFEFEFSSDDKNISSATEREVFKIYKKKKAMI